MRRNSSLLWSSTALVALVAIASPAAAQQADPATPVDPTVEAQESPADPEQGSPQTDDAVQTASGQDQATPGDETIVVTGLRRSLQSAQNIKRNSEQIVDAIVAEDIGKLPDLAVSETAARIPGVQVIRRGGEADTVLVRGLPDFSTTYNGREIFTAERREVALQDFPAANIAALEVFKTTTANLVEAGLAGQVNVRSRRPFDFRGTEIAGSAWGLRTKQAEKWNPNFNVLASTRWDTGVGEMGLLLNFSRTELDYLDSEPSNTDFLMTFRQEGNDLIPDFVNGQDARFPDVQRLFYRSGNRVRPSANAAFQWRPGPDLMFYAEGLYQGFRNKIDDRLVAVPLFNGGTYSNLQFRDGTNLLESGTVTGLGDPIFTFQGGTFNKTDTYQYAVGGNYETGPLRLSADLARTKSTFVGSTESVDRIFAGQAETIVDFDLNTPEFTIRNFDASNPANYFFDGLYEQKQRSEGDDYQARLDAEYDLDGSAFARSVQAGVRYSDRDAHREFGERFAGYRGQNILATVLPLDFEMTPPGFQGTDVQSGFNSFLSPTYDSIRDNREALRAFVIANPGCCDQSRFTLEDVEPNPTSVYDANEKTLAGYAQLNFAFGDAIDGVVGIRAVRTDTTVNGTSNVEGVLTPVAVGNEYTDYLPNASVRWRAMDNLQLRLSATQTRTRPTFEQLNPSATLGPPDPLAGGRRTGGGGNPFLEPFTSNNYDASLEYYFSRTGLAAVAVFRRDLDGFIQNNTIDFEDPELGPIRVTGPVNTRKGRIDGLEAQISTFFDWEWMPTFLRNFGAQANYSYLDAKTEVLNPFTDDFDNVRLLGVSKHTYNLVGMYEGNGLTARLSYNKRGKFLDRRDFRGPAGNPDDPGRDLYTEEGDPAGRMDLSTSYTLTDNFTVFFDWTNILEDPFKSRLSSARGGQPRADFVRFLRFEETTYSLGIRARFGGAGRRVAPPAPVVLPPPPPAPIYAPAPMIEPPAPPPPPPPQVERG
ncbi:MAG: TonB-dependent receptor [Sphingomicrobium sp.]